MYNDGLQLLSSFISSLLVAYPLLPFNHQLLMREAAKQLKIEQEKKEAERRKVIFFTELFVIFSFVIIIIFKNDKMARA